VALAAAGLGGCVFAGVKSQPGREGREPREFAFEAVYHVSCSVSDECRVTYIDRDGELSKKDVTGEWEYDMGADPGRRLWVRAGAGGCPPRPVRVEILVDHQTVAEHLARPPGGSRCEWILAETEFRIP